MVETSEALREEIERLRLRNEALEQRLARYEPQGAAASEGLGEHEPRIPYREIVECIPMPLILYRPDGMTIAVNEQVLKTSGARRETLVGKYNIHSDPRTREAGFTEAFDRAAAGGEIVRMAPTSYGASEPGAMNDRRWWFQTTYIPIRDPAGAPYIVAISADITEQQRASAALRESASVLRAIVDSSPALITTSSLQGRYLLVNEKAARLLGVAAGQPSDKLDDILPRELAERHRQSDQQVAATGKPLEWEERFCIADELCHFVTTKFPLRDLEDRVYAICTVSIDMTAFRRAEAENKKLQEEIIRVQGETLRALSTPLLPIAAGVVVMPLIGTLERARMEQVLEALLGGMVAHRASCAIVDVTGVPVVNAEVASALIKAAQAVRLVGAKVVLTGIQPGIARTLVELGADLSGIVTKGTLESGIAYALGR